MHDVTQTMLSLTDVTRTFTIRQGLLRHKINLKAVNSVSLHLKKGDVLGLVGESGCGKSTLAMMILGLLKVTSGHIVMNETPIEMWQHKRIARNIQPIFQDPYAALNPRKTIGQIISLPLRVHSALNQTLRRKKVEEMLALVGLSPNTYHRYPGQLSGGQRQRVAIGRALITKPNMVICDEPTSALDVSVQSQILNLLIDFRHMFDLTYILISHNLAVVEHLATHVAVMYLGKIMETSDTDQLFHKPLHPYTQALLDSILLPVPQKKEPKVTLGHALPNPLDPPKGCLFHPRCPEVMSICKSIPPPKVKTSGGYVVCHLHKQVGREN